MEAGMIIVLLSIISILPEMIEHLGVFVQTIELLLFRGLSMM